jgi:hypothetical protein
MSFTYGDDAAEIITKLRDEIDDTQEKPDGVFPDGRNFSDERLTELYSDEGQHLGRFIARCCEILARAYARYPTATRLGPEDETVNAFEHYTTEASRLRRLHGYVGGRRRGALSVPTEVRL